MEWWRQKRKVFKTGQKKYADIYIPEKKKTLIIKYI